MDFDIIYVSEEDLASYSDVQMQLLRTAQKKKNKLRYDLEKEMDMFRQVALANNLCDATLIEHKRAELEADFDYQVGIIAEQLEYSLQLNSPTIDDEELENVGYIVDFSLSYFERYNIVKNYYLSIEDPAERMALYASDDVAKKYLNSYYYTLYDILSSYSQ